MKRLLDWLEYYDDSITNPLLLRRKRAFILTSLFSALIIAADIVQNRMVGFETLAMIEMTVLPLIALNFFMAKESGMQHALYSNIMAFLLSLTILTAMVIEGFGMQIMLFWIAALPLLLFLLLNLRQAMIANMIITLVLVVMTLNSYVGWIKPLFAFDIFLQLMFGYPVYVVLVYLIEQSRSLNEKELLERDRERDVLLKEVHHRVKNNMQLMMSLLGLQASNIEDKAYAKLFTDNIDRLSAMALVHESIYKAENFEKIDMQSYLEDIVKHLQRVTRHQIDYSFDPVILDMKTAMNLGLILNEAVTNALEHAYPDTQEGRITLSLHEKGTIIKMKIEDFGCGIADIEAEQGNLGLTLMHDLTRSLNEGRLEMTSKKGLAVQVECKGYTDAA